MKGVGPVQKKILLVLLGGAALGCSYSPKQSFHIVGTIKREWKKINKQSLERAIERLYETHLIDISSNKDGRLKIILTEDGKKRALFFNLNKFEIKKPAIWDKKWRLVVFDIPEEQRKIRNIFRDWLRRLDFYRLQDSVFVFPYDCKKEFDFLVELHQIRRYARFIVAQEIDNELHLKKIFRL